MDNFTTTHFYAWLERYVHPDFQTESEQRIRALLRDYPDMVLSHTWPEMHDIARRNYA